MELQSLSQAKSKLSPRVINIGIKYVTGRIFRPFCLNYYRKIKLRVYVTGGGCSGFQYGFSFDAKKAAEDDTSIQKGDITVLIDALSIQYLAGSIVDYEIDLMGSRFTVVNPNAVTTCGCGASFSI